MSRFAPRPRNESASLRQAAAPPPGLPLALCDMLVRDQAAGGDLAIRFWDGREWRPRDARAAAFTLDIKHPAALRRLLRSPTELSLAESYIYGDFDIIGDVTSALVFGEGLLQRHWRWRDKWRAASSLLALPRDGGPRAGRRAAALAGVKHGKRRDRKAISYHYDVSNDFFALWLDARMVYSCAYFADPEADDLDAAQERKLDHICRKLRLRPGERLLDIGCGWGSLLIHAARKYGVVGEGITLSEKQAALARARIAEAGLAAVCRVTLRDYRDLRGDGRFDKIASVGMSEHVAPHHLEGYCRQAWRLLRPGGLFLNHAIAAAQGTGRIARESLINRYIFPDAQLVPVSVAQHAAERAGFEVRDVECLREHYERTLLHWLRRLEARHDEVAGITDEATYRTWRLFLAGSALGFRTGKLKLYQCLYAKPHASGRCELPLTRADLYAPGYHGQH